MLVEKGLAQAEGVNVKYENPGVPYEESVIKRVRVNRSAVERRAETLMKRRSVKKEWQIAWLLRAVTCIDLTTLSGDDTAGRVHRLCQKAKNPIHSSILEGYGFQPHEITVGAVCVYSSMVKEAVNYLKGTDIPVAAVSTGFPAAQIPIDIKIAQIKHSVKEGAKEIDIVISRELVLQEKWEELYEEVRLFKQAAGSAHLKTILATGELGRIINIAKASMVCMMAGADFIKTSTGKEKINATLPVSLVMCRSIREYARQTEYKVGFKPAGGISKARDATNWLILMKEELGEEWMYPSRFRIGASTLLSDIERQLEYHSTGRYSTFYHHALG